MEKLTTQQFEDILSSGYFAIGNCVFDITGGKYSNARYVKGMVFIDPESDSGLTYIADVGWMVHIYETVTRTDVTMHFR